MVRKNPLNLNATITTVAETALKNWEATSKRTLEAIRAAIKKQAPDAAFKEIEIQKEFKTGGVSQSFSFKATAELAFKTASHGECSVSILGFNGNLILSTEIPIPGRDSHVYTDLKSLKKDIKTIFGIV
jgi:hypothetical protein